MSDQSQDPQSETDEVFVSFDDRVELEAAEIFGKHGLVDEEGNTSLHLIADLIEPTITAAVVTKPSDRAKVGVTPTKLMEEYFSDVPGPTEWANYGSKDDEEYKFRQKVYKKVKDHVFRVLLVQPNGIIQRRLANGNGGLVLCRTVKEGGREEMAYVTRNHNCIRDDLMTPEMRKVKAGHLRVARLTAMAVERVPEHANLFVREYRSEIKLGIESGENVIVGALEAQTASSKDTDASTVSV